MANIDAANGFQVVGTLDGSDYHGKAQKCSFLAATGTACFIGDVVKLTGTGSADATSPEVTQCAAGDRPYGVLVSLDPNFADEGSLSSANYRVASTLRTGRVIPMDGLLCSVQEDSVGGSMSQLDIGMNVDIATVGSGNTVTGASAMEIQSASPATSNAVVFRLVELDASTGNAVGTNARWIVTSNLTNLNNTTGVS